MTVVPTRPGPFVQALRQVKGPASHAVGGGEEGDGAEVKRETGRGKQRWCVSDLLAVLLIVPSVRLLAGTGQGRQDPVRLRVRTGRVRP